MKAAKQKRKAGKYSEKKPNNTGNWFSKLIKDKTFQRVLLIFLISKILVVGIGTLAISTYPDDRVLHVSDNRILNGWAQWDGRAYLSIITEGYNFDWNGSGNTAWFPLYSVLMKGLGTIFGGSLDAYIFAGLLIANLASLLAIFYMYKLVEEEFNKELSYKACLYLLLFPTAYFFSTLYAESLFLFLTVAAFYYANKRKWMLASIFGFFSVLARMPGVVIFVAFLYMYLDDRKFEIKKVKADVLWLFLIPAAIVCYSIYLWFVLGNPLAFMIGHDVYGRAFSWPWVPYAKGIGLLISSIQAKNILSAFAQSYHIFMMLLLPFCIWYVYKMKKYAYAIYMFLAYFMMAISSIPTMSRQIVVLFPTFIAIADLSSKKNRKINCEMLINLMYVIFVILMVVFTIRHITFYVLPGVPAIF